jgi:hypothetical protein
MNPTRLLGVLLICGAALAGAPVAQASSGDDFTPNEIAFLNDLAAEDLGPVSSAESLMDEGWTICHALASGMSPSTAAGKVYSGSHTASAAGVSQAQAVHVVAHAIDDLCPSMTQSAVLS